MKNVKQEVKQSETKIAYEGILYNAFNRAVFARSEDPYRLYPLTVEALVIAVPKWGHIEENIKKFQEGEWVAIKRKLESTIKDDRRRKVLVYDALFEFIKHELEDNNLLLKFRNIPVGGGFDSY